MNPTTQGITVGADIKTLHPAIPSRDPDDISRHFDDTCFAPICLGLAAEALLDGKTERLRFVRARRNSSTGIWEIVDQVFVGLDDGSDDEEGEASYKKGSVRWCGGDDGGDPMGNWSSSIIASWSRYHTNPACVAAALAHAFANPDLAVFWIALDGGAK